MRVVIEKYPNNEIRNVYTINTSGEAKALIDYIHNNTSFTAEMRLAEYYGAEYEPEDVLGSVEKTA